MTRHSHLLSWTTAAMVAATGLTALPVQAQEMTAVSGSSENSETLQALMTQLQEALSANDIAVSHQTNTVEVLLPGMTDVALAENYRGWSQRSVVGLIAEILGDYPESEVRLALHSPSSDALIYNDAAGARAAQGVADVLVANGYLPQAITIDGVVMLMEMPSQRAYGVGELDQIAIVISLVQ